MHNVITNAWRGDPYPIDTLLIFMANMAWNSTMNTSEVRKMLNDKRRGRRVQDSVPRRLRCVPVRDDGVRRPRAAGHDVPRAARRDVDARPADLGVRRPGRFRAHSGPAADRRVQAVPGGADRARGPAEAAGLRAPGRHPQVPRLPGFHRQLRDGTGLGHRLPRRLARQGRREVHARRAQSAAVGDVRAEQLRLPAQAAAVLPVHAQLEQGLPRVVAAQPHPALRRADPDPPVFRGAAEVPPRRAGQGHVAQAAGGAAEAHRDLLRSAAVLLRAAGSAAADSRSTRSTR